MIRVVYALRAFQNGDKGFSDYSPQHFCFFLILILWSTLSQSATRPWKLFYLLKCFTWILIQRVDKHRTKGAHPPRLARSYSERVDENGNDKKDGSNGRSAAINRAELQIMNRLFFSHNNYYSAYFCCAEADDDSFGRPFHHQLEEWGFRIFYAIRDLQLNGPKYDNMANAIEERCNGKIIVVLSHNYLKSDECLFLTYFARTLDPDSKKRNIIPVMIDRDVEIINVLKGLAIIKYNHDFKNNWLKKKIVDAIAA